MMKVNITLAAKQLSGLIKATQNGETVIICRRGKPVVDMVPTTMLPQPKRKSKGKREFGFLRDKIIEVDPNWWKSED